MELQMVSIENGKLIPSGASMEDISIRRTGIAKVLWRNITDDVPASEIIAME